MKRLEWNAAFAALLLFSLLGCSLDGVAVVTITNNSNETIKLLTIKVGEEMQEAENIEVGESVEMKFLVQVDSSYLASVEFLSGKQLEEAVGYLTSTLVYRDKVFIGDSDIFFDRMSVSQRD